jgi:hypothetical protein
MKITLPAALCLVVLLVLSAGCSPKTGYARPSKVVTAYFNAFKAGHYNEAYKLLSKDDRSQISLEKYKEEAAKQVGTPSTEPFTFKILDEKTELKDSVVGVQLSQGGQSETMYIVLVRELGAWRVSLDQSNTMNN